MVRLALSGDLEGKGNRGDCEVKLRVQIKDVEVIDGGARMGKEKS